MNESRAGVVAIDGPSASGKSSTARDVARRLGLVHVNSGLLYRAITWAGLRDGWIDTPEFEKRLHAMIIELRLDPPTYELWVDGERAHDWLKSAEVTAGVSRVAARSDVRDRVNEALRAAARTGGVVVDGRDIGTAVFPDALLKIFLTARVEERARRRLAERGSSVGLEIVAREVNRLVERDRLDSTRILAPLLKADDAIEIDTTAKDAAAVVDEIVHLFEARSAHRDEASST
jgi:cytidylate kinase